MKLGATPEPPAERLYALFATEVEALSYMQLMTLVDAFKSDPSWSKAPGWAKAAFRRIADGMAE